MGEMTHYTSPSNIRFGSLAAARPGWKRGCFTPESGRGSRPQARQLKANRTYAAMTPKRQLRPCYLSADEMVENVVLR